MRAVAVSSLPGAEIARHFREHHETAKAPRGESYDKRYTPSTFISENRDGSFRVGWITRGAQYECVREFENLAEAATDYLLFSLGKCRWTPTKESEISFDTGVAPDLLTGRAGSLESLNHSASLKFQTDSEPA
jgi:hypothetical protein